MKQKQVSKPKKQTNFEAEENPFIWSLVRYLPPPPTLSLPLYIDAGI